MGLSLKCPKCEKKLSISLEHAGRSAKCPACDHGIKLPSAETIRAHMAKAASASPPAPVAAAGDTHDLSGGDSPFGDGFDELGSSNNDSLFEDENPFAAPLASGTPLGAESRTHSGQGYAGFWPRFVANFIDNIIVSAATFALLIAYQMLAVVLVAALGKDTGGLIIGIGLIPVVLALFVLPWIYHAKMESSPSGATIGKKALGIVVTDLNGGQISFMQATGRFFGKIISALPLYIGFVMAGCTERKQALHDMLANTLVIKK